MTMRWLIAALAVGAMGFAIQRGGTCTVAAVSELLDMRRVNRLAAMLEASLWVAGGLALASLLGIAGSMPAGFTPDRWTVIGAALLGLGAWVAGACVFGAMARLGSGEWAYALAPLGFYLGCLSAAPLFARSAAQVDATTSPLIAGAAVCGPLFALYAVWRIWPALRVMSRRDGLAVLRAAVWSPHAATIVIGIAFVITLLLAGRWAYTDVLADLAQDMAASLGGPLLLFAALLAGAMLGGWSAGRWGCVPLSLPQALRCLTGGALMGWGSLLIPGSNDGLILIGIPLLRPYAWLAFATMCATIAIARTLQRSWAARRWTRADHPPA
jgi:uncharacterized membrane protein YedE/YeeE